VGFHYAYDPVADQYAHPSGLVVVTPEGKTSRYFFGIEFPPAQVDAALRTASASRVSSPVEDFLLLCCRYNPLQGRYGVLIFNVMRLSGCLTVLALAGGVIYLARTDTTQRPASPALKK